MLKIANAPCSWGVLEFDLERDVADYAQVLDEIRATGYVGTELGDWGFFPTDPAQLRDELARRNLLLFAAFVPVDFSNPANHAAGRESALRVARLLAAAGDNSPVVVLADDNGKNPGRTKGAGRIQLSQSLTSAQWDVFARAVDDLARVIREQTGVRAVFHHHGAGFVETPAEIETLLERTNPDLVGLCFDTGHYRLGGGDVILGLEKHAARIGLVHFKDFDPQIAEQARANDWDYFQAVHHGIFCELGKGDVNFRAVLDWLVAHNYDGWITVEQDVLPGMGTPKASAQRNRDYLRSLGV